MAKIPSAGPPKKGAQTDKVRLTKQQKIRAAQIIRIENRISVCRQYIKLWAQLFRFFAEPTPGRKATPDEEKAFFQVITALARKHFLFNELMGDTFSLPDKIMEVLYEASSLQKIISLDEVALAKLELEWHTLFIEMNVGLGRLLRLMPGSLSIDEMLAQSESIATEIQAQAQAGLLPAQNAGAPPADAPPPPKRGILRRKA
jgi:hypothetical protein